jgi:carbamoyltransferase
MSKTYTKILGIHYGHDAGVAIVENGKVIAAINEERIRNIKHYNGIPSFSLNEIFKISKIHPSEIDAIAIIGISDVSKLSESSAHPIYAHLYYTWNSITSNPTTASSFTSHNLRFRNSNEIKTILDEIGVSTKEILFVEHHLGHAAGAYYLSPWNLDEDVLIFTADAAGDGLSSTVSIGHNGQIERLKDSESTYYHSLGYCFYGEITNYLGMVEGDHEYKVMGLAPYGKSSYCLDKIKGIIDIDSSNPLKFKNHMNSFKPSFEIELRKLLRGQRFDNIAAATQEWFETLNLKWIRDAIEKTGIHKIACAGGNFLNVKANQKILALEDVDDAFFCPAAGDEGLAVGAALIGYYEMSIMSGKKPEKNPLTDVYLGSSFSNEEIEESLKKHSLLDKAEYVDDIDVAIGELLAKDSNIIARFSGQMEWGPRGLGNRSIIANPSDHAVVRKINHAIKMRDFWMPFGPSILESRMQDYVVNPTNAPYMILAFDTTEKRNEMTAAIHPYDFTCRPQTVSSDYNPGYEKVLKSFENKTGIGAVLNTSFNLHGNPIVWSPEIAIDTFNNSELDVITLGNYLLKKN